MNKTVEFVGLSKKAAGKTVRLELHYKHLDGPNAGEVWRIGNLAVNLSDECKKALKTAKPGDCISIETVKNGDFWNLVNVTAGASPNPTKAAPKKQTEFNVGVKVGQARNQAVQVLCSRLEQGLIKEITSDMIRDQAFEYILEIEHMEEMIAKGLNPKTLETRTPEEVPTTQENDDDIPF